MTTSDLAAATEAWSTTQDARFALEQELTAQRLALNLALGQPADQPVMLKAGAGFPELPPGSDNARVSSMDWNNGGSISSPWPSATKVRKHRCARR